MQGRVVAQIELSMRLETVRWVSGFRGDLLPGVTHQQIIIQYRLKHPVREFEPSTRRYKYTFIGTERLLFLLVRVLQA